MADVSAHTPTFSRGSSVLDYWLAHAEGLTIQPLGARVEHVVVTPPVGHAESLIVRSRMTRRRRAIPAESIAAVEPSTGHLLLDAAEFGAGRRIPRPSPERIAAARVSATNGGRVARAHAAGAARSTRAGTVSAVSWLRPRAGRAGAATARYSMLAAAKTTRGVGWLAPRVAAGARTAGAIGAWLTLAAAMILARGAVIFARSTVIFARSAVHAARELERAAATAAARWKSSIEARRAQQRVDTDD